jgi:hypothetical protein
MATETDKIKTGALGTLVAVGLFATLSIMLAVTALVRYRVRGVADSRQDLAEQPYRDLREEQRSKISATPTWTDKGQGKVSMPIDRAKAKVLGELARDPANATPPAPAQPTGASDATGTAAGVVPGEGAPGAAPKGVQDSGATPEQSAPAPAAPAPSPTHAAAQKKPAPATTVATAKPAAPTTAAATAPAAPAPAAPAAPKPTDG